MPPPPSLNEARVMWIIGNCHDSRHNRRGLRFRELRSRFEATRISADGSKSQSSLRRLHTETITSEHLAIDLVECSGSDSFVVCVFVPGQARAPRGQNWNVALCPISRKNSLMPNWLNQVHVVKRRSALRQKLANYDRLNATSKWEPPVLCSTTNIQPPSFLLGSRLLTVKKREENDVSA